MFARSHNSGCFGVVAARRTRRRIVGQRGVPVNRPLPVGRRRPRPQEVRAGHHARVTRQLREVVRARLPHSRLAETQRAHRIAVRFEHAVRPVLIEGPQADLAHSAAHGHAAHGLRSRRGQVAIRRQRVGQRTVVDPVAGTLGPTFGEVQCAQRFGDSARWRGRSCSLLAGKSGQRQRGDHRSVGRLVAAVPKRHPGVVKLSQFGLQPLGDARGGAFAQSAGQAPDDRAANPTPARTPRRRSSFRIRSR